MKFKKFDLLYEDIMTDLNTPEQEMSDVYTSILKICKFNPLTNEFDDKNKTLEIYNFKFHEPDAVRSEQLTDLTFNEGEFSEDDDIGKIIVTDKNTDKTLYEGIAYLGKDMDEIIDLLSYTDNPRSTF